MFEAVPFCLAFAAILYCHGMQWFYPKLPTTINRIVCILLMTGLTMMRLHYENFWGFAVFLSLSIALWIIPGWMSEITNALGENPDCPRWRGTLQMTARQALIAPFLCGLCGILGHSLWPLVGIAFMGLPYYITGFFTGKLYRFNVVGAHAIVGMIIGAMIWCITN